MSTKAGNPPPLAHRPGRSRAFTLTELLIAMSLSLMIAAAVLSALIHIGRSGYSIANYCEMDQKARSALEYIGRDIKQCDPASTTAPLSVSIQNAGAANEQQVISLAIPSPVNPALSVKVEYTYLAADSARNNSGTLTRRQYNAGSTTTDVLIEDIEPGTFVIAGSTRPDPATNVGSYYTGAANVSGHIASIKQIQLRFNTKANALYTRLTGGSSQQIITAQYSIRRKKS